MWSRLAESIAERSPSGGIILSVLGVDASSVSDWTRDGPLSDRLRDLLDALRRDQVRVSAVLWQQGEADARAGVSAEQYAAALGILIRRLRDGGIVAPVLLGRSTRCRNSGNNEVRKGVALAAAREVGVFLGPDTDALGDDYRSDGCHFNGAGLDSAADAWRKALVEREIVPRPRPGG